MDKPWYRKMFSATPTTPREVTAATADYENAEVQFGMGLKLAGGGATQDYVQAAQWYRKAADQCHPLAQLNLGTMYAHGQGVARDDAQSVIWFGKAAEQGDAGAQFHLGTSCHRASFGGVPEGASESRIEAYKWYQLAATQGYVGAEAARTNLIFKMTRADIAEAGRRIASFESGHPAIAAD